MDPDDGVEQNVVTQLLEQQDAVLQVAQVSGEGQHDVQDGPRHVHLGRLEHRQRQRVGEAQQVSQYVWRKEKTLTCQ